MKRTEEKKTPSKLKMVLGYLFFGVVTLLGALILGATEWSLKELNVTLEEIIFTLTTPLNGNGGGVIIDALKFCLPLILLVVAVYAALVVLDCKANNFKFIAKLKEKHKFDLQNVLRSVFALVSVGFLMYSILNFYMKYDVQGYIDNGNAKTAIYDDNYIYPENVSVKPGENGTKNLICIYLESMESTYANASLDDENRGNIIPNLTKLAEDNISFSNSEELGGFYEGSGMSWTIGSLFATTCGTQLKSSIQSNGEKENGTFAPGVVSLGDILEENGYVQEFLCGSDGNYAGRATYFKQHGNYKIFDLYSAIEEGYLPEDYFVWWGYEDKYLFQIAKDELTELASQGKPFNFTMLTVDTHYPDGYVCDLCGDEYEKIAANVISCSDKQVFEFVQWIQQQDFYEDTVIVIMGDHARMDMSTVEGYERYERTMYNCIINSDYDKTSLETTNRLYVAMDMFPTILSAIGFEVEGERLGLGTNLFSDKKTWMEEMGQQAYLGQLTRKSDTYYTIVNGESE